MASGTPTIPNPGPSVTTGLYANRVSMTPEQQDQFTRWAMANPDATMYDRQDYMRQLGVQLPTLPTYTDWQSVWNDPYARSLVGSGESAADQATGLTNYARDVYGLSGDYQFDEQGNLVDSQSWLARNAWWLVPAAALGGGTAAGAWFGGGAALPAATVGSGYLGPVGLTAGLGGEATAAGTALGAGTMGAEAFLPSTVIGGGYTAGTPGLAASLAGAAGGGTPSLSTLAKIAEALRGGAGAVGSATQAAANNRLTQAEFNLRNLDQTTRNRLAAQTAYEQSYGARASEEDKQRATLLNEATRANFLENQMLGPYNQRGVTPLSPQYRKILDDLSAQAATRLAQPQQYTPNAMTPLTQVDVQPATWIEPSTGERVGNYVAPTLSTIAAIAKAFA